jgi:hypothetical protein
MDWTIIVGALGVLGTFAGVGATIYVARRHSSPEAAEFTIEGSPWVRERLRGNYEKFLRLLLGIDYASLHGLTDASAGNAETKSKVFEKSPETWSLVVSRNREIVGYWSFFSLSDKLVKKLKNGTMRDSEITADEVHRLTEPRVHALYVEMFGIHPSYEGNQHRILRMLLNSLHELMASLRENGVKVVGIYANGFSKEGTALCKDFGLTPLVKSIQGGDVYFLEDISVAEQNLERLTNRRRFPAFGK